MLALMRRHGLRGTFLVQYDALKEPYLTMLQENTDICEIGMWFELVQPLVEAAGEVWRGERMDPDRALDRALLIAFKVRNRYQ